MNRVFLILTVAFVFLSGCSEEPVAVPGRADLEEGEAPVQRKLVFPKEPYTLDFERDFEVSSLGGNKVPSHSERIRIRAYLVPEAADGGGNRVVSIVIKHAFIAFAGKIFNTDDFIPEDQDSEDGLVNRVKSMSESGQSRNELAGQLLQAQFKVVLDQDGRLIGDIGFDEFKALIGKGDLYVRDVLEVLDRVLFRDIREGEFRIWYGGIFPEVPVGKGGLWARDFSKDLGRWGEWLPNADVFLKGEESGKEFLKWRSYWAWDPVRLRLNHARLLRDKTRLSFVGTAEFNKQLGYFTRSDETITGRIHMKYRNKTGLIAIDLSERMTRTAGEATSESQPATE